MNSAAFEPDQLVLNKKAYTTRPPIHAHAAKGNKLTLAIFSSL